MNKRRCLTALRFVLTAVFLSIVLCLIAISTHSTAEQQAQSSPPTAPQTSDANQDEIVMFTVTVTTNERNSFPYVSGLGKENFTVQEKSATPEIVLFNNQTGAPFSVGVLIDTSGSMFYTENKEKALIFETQLLNLFRIEHADTEYFFAEFNTKTTLLRDWSRDLSGTYAFERRDKEESGNTSLNDACYLGIEKTLTGKHERKALIIISDGLDNTSKRKFKEIRELARNSDLLIYAIDASFSKDAESYRGAVVLDELTSVSGGRTYYPTTLKELREIIERVTADLRYTYRIGIKASNRSNRWREVKFKVTLPPDAQGKSKSARVRSRQGYTPVQPSQQLKTQD